jgi:hypothetical protein
MEEKEEMPVAVETAEMAATGVLLKYSILAEWTWLRYILIFKRGLEAQSEMAATQGKVVQQVTLDFRFHHAKLLYHRKMALMVHDAYQKGGKAYLSPERMG